MSCSPSQAKDVATDLVEGAGGALSGDGRAGGCSASSNAQAVLQGGAGEGQLCRLAEAGLERLRAPAAPLRLLL